MCPDTHRARKPQIPTPPHSCPSAMYADTWSSLFKKIKKSHDRSGSYFTTTAERKGTHWPWLVHGRKTFETPTPMGPDTELHPLEAPTLRGESVKLLKTDPSINKSIQHWPWREPPSLQPPSNSIYDCSHSLTSQQPEINSGLSNPNPSSSSPSPKLAELQGPVSKEVQPLLEHSSEHRGSLSAMGPGTHSSISLSIDSNTCNHIIRKVLKRKHKQFGFIIKINWLMINCSALEAIYWLPLSNKVL